MRIEPKPQSRTSKAVLARFLFGALAIRWAYDIVLFFAMGTAGLTTPDSDGYLGYAHEFANHLLKGFVEGWLWLGPSPYMMPLFTWMLTPHVLLFGKFAPLTYVMCQGVLDAAVCLNSYWLAETIDRRFALPAAIAAGINPTQIVMSGLVLSDTPFVFFVSIFLVGSARWLRTPSWSAAIAIGCGLGGALTTRVIVTPWAAALLVFLIAVVAISGRLQTRHVAQMIAAGAIFAICTAPILARNVMQYGSMALTAQSGLHLNWFVVPLIKEVRDGTPWARSYEEMAQRTRDRFGPPVANPFEESRRETQIAIEELRKISLADIAKAWIYGAVINLASPAIIQSPPVAALPRTGFYVTPGASKLDKIGNFLFHSDNALYGWLLFIGVIGVAVMRLIEAIGLIAVLRQGGNLAIVLLIGGWCLFILAVNGPVAAPKYRLPLEPVLMVLTGAGLSTLCRWRRGPAGDQREPDHA